mmetsp:Transcript_26147/g.29290  ORF Transcript_26147/g.29290 Transcript_26147/m.29290 type:complete len:146 (+) Transcript_26147:333-770(+)
MSGNCESFSALRSRCHDVYGKHRGEECVHEELSEKRCISFQRCPRHAIEYYGENDDIYNYKVDNKNDENNNNNNPRRINTKALCASWAESFVYANKELEHGENIAKHHREARQIVSNNTKLRKECRQIAFDLAECLRDTKKKDWW